MSDALPIWAFVAVTLPLVLTPGASTAVVLRNGMGGGLRAGLVTALGTNTGSLCYGLLSGFGLAAAVNQWPATWAVLRTAGALYLAWLGVQSLRQAFTGGEAWLACSPAAAGRGTWTPLGEGLATNLLNPSIATFYLVLLPQFVPVGAPVATSVLALTAIHIAMAGTWHVAWAIAGGSLAHSLASPRARRILDAASGVALAALALALVLR